MPEDEDNRRDFTGLIIALILSPVLLLFIYFDKGEFGRAVCFDLAAVLVAIRLRWDLRGRAWFWGTIVFLLALHVPILLIIRWPEGWVPGAVALPFAAIDCAIILGSLRLAEKLFSKNPPDDQPPHRGDSTSADR
jgi:hypothetical protein